MTPASIWLGALGLFGIASAVPAAAQGLMQHIDLISPEMTSAEMSRQDVEAVIAASTSARPVDLTGRRLSGLDLSGLDLSGAILRAARNKARGADRTRCCKELRQDAEPRLPPASMSRAPHLRTAAEQAASGAAIQCGRRLRGRANVIRPRARLSTWRREWRSHPSAPAKGNRRVRDSAPSTGTARLPSGWAAPRTR
jgi:hypothetical protein